VHDGKLRVCDVSKEACANTVNQVKGRSRKVCAAPEGSALVPTPLSQAADSRVDFAVQPLTAMGDAAGRVSVMAEFVRVLRVDVRRRRQTEVLQWKCAVVWRVPAPANILPQSARDGEQ
jgi:hypothetical protein